jgi:hypothetical protein
MWTNPNLSRESLFFLHQEMTELILTVLLYNKNENLNLSCKYQISRFRNYFCGHIELPTLVISLPTLVSSLPTLVSSLPTLVRSLPTLVSSLPTLVSSLPTLVSLLPTLVSSLPTLVERGGVLSPLPLPTPASLATSHPPPSSPLLGCSTSWGAIWVAWTVHLVGAG